MKKSLIALAVLAASGVASAQSSVQLYGIVDAAVGSYRSDVANVTKMQTSGTSSSQLGFKGTEDLGGGMKANFWLEAGLNPDAGLGQATSANNQAASTNAGGLVFNRRSTVSLSGAFGEVRLGRDYVPSFWNLTVFDPFGTVGVSAATNLNVAGLGQTAVRASNSVAYHYGFAPNATYAVGTGLYASVMTAFGENASNVANSSDGNYTGLRVGYAGGPLNVAFATGTTRMLTGDTVQTNVGASYNLGVANVMVDWAQNKVGATAKNTTVLLGANIPMGPNGSYIPVSFNRYTSTNAAGANGGSANQFGIGYVYKLSARSAVYGTYARLSNSDGLAAAVSGAPASTVNGASSGLEVGVRHAF